jgi:DNA polymerase-3 subunit delta'
MYNVNKKSIIGHHPQLQLLNAFLHKKKMHHSFLFCGPEHVGKMTIARSFAQKLIGGETNEGWMICDVAHSDLVTIAPIVEEKKGKMVYKDISLDQLFSARRSFALAPDQKAKVLIIDDAERMTISAQNALLKTLEEPQKNRFIILVAHRPDQLLETIVSRCFVVHFSLVNDPDFHAQGFDQQCVDDAQGRPGYAYRLQDDPEFVEIISFARDQLRTLSRMSLVERMQLATELSKKDEKYLSCFFYAWIYRVRLAALQTKKFHLLKIAQRVESVLVLLQDTNVNKQLAIEDLLIHIT